MKSMAPLHVRRQIQLFVAVTARIFHGAVHAITHAGDSNYYHWWRFKWCGMNDKGLDDTLFWLLLFDSFIFDAW